MPYRCSNCHRETDSLQEYCPHCFAKISNYNQLVTDNRGCLIVSLVLLIFIAVFLFWYMEEIYWFSAKNDNTIEKYNFYLADYPKGKYASEAKKRLKALEDKKK